MTDKTRIIWKYAIPMPGTTLKMPKHSHILCAKMQNDTITLWAMVDPDEEVEARTFMIIGTGNPIPKEAAKNLCYIDTVFADIFVWHIFEEFEE